MLQNNFKALNFLSVNLQKFSEDDIEENTNVNEDVVDSQEEVEDNFGEDNFADDQEDQEENSDQLDQEEEDVPEDQEDQPNRVQTPKENDQFKKMRLKAEAEAKKKIELERAEFERQKREFEEAKNEKSIRDQYLSQEKIWDKADQEGVSEEVAKKMLELEVDKVIETEKVKVRQRFEQIQNQKAKYQTDPYFNEVNSLVEEAMKQDPNLDYDTPYKYFYYDKIRELDNTKEKNTVKRTLANVQDGMKRRTVPTSASSNEMNNSLSREGKEMANAFGVDSRKVAKRIATKFTRK